ncbi:hypothetical protein [Rhodohalobacter sp. 8-1]|uniref:hypothetical protein n=1 Tax=Rhodohalobacter sp. 8-1 TaxID=3131972 RepID=UPI0030ECECBE
MQTTLRVLILTAAAALLLNSCDTSLDGNLNENQPPNTSLTVDNIEVDEENRLSSRVNISWWGDDPDGYVDGYEYAISDVSEDNWRFTTRTDSVFILPISPGEDIENVLFAVRAIDNEGKRDPDPASIEFPLRNSKPVTELNTLELPPDTTFSIASFGWSISDPDGLPTVQRTEIAINDSINGWVEIPIEAEDQQDLFISVDINQDGESEGTADVYLGRNYRETNIQISGFQFDQLNTVYVRTVDAALAESEIQSYEWYLKRQTSNVLILNDDASSSSNENLEFTLSKLSGINIAADVIDISGGEGFGSNGIVPLSTSFPRIVNPTLNRALAQWDHIYWVSSSLQRNINYAPEILGLFFDNGGTVFFNALSRVQSSTNPLLNFLPIQRYVSIDATRGETGYQIRDSYEVRPLAGGPLMTYQGGLNNGIWPFIPFNGEDALYEAELLKRGFFPGGLERYDGPSTIAAINPEGNLIFFGIPIIDFKDDGQEDNVEAMLQELLINRLGFTTQQ